VVREEGAAFKEESMVREEAGAYGSQGKAGGKTKASSRRLIQSSKRKGKGDAAGDQGSKDVRASSPRLLQPVTVRPDFVFRELRVAVFVDGCFWHGCPRCYIRPGQNRKFWDAKHATNKERDRKVNRALKAAGWTVLRLWEHELALKRRKGLLRKLERVLGG